MLRSRKKRVRTITPTKSETALATEAPQRHSAVGVGKGLAALRAKRGSLANAAYTQIRDEILRGNFGIGDILSRRNLAEMLNMSFIPTTEALQRLEVEGLVESRPRIGTRVRIPTEEDIRGSYVIREALEAQSARLCASNITADEKKQLKKSADHLDHLYLACQADTDPLFLFSVHTYHMQFHMRIAEIARCSGLSKVIEKEQVLVFNWLYDTTARRTISPPNFHGMLANALCSGDAIKADVAMRAHVQYGMQQVLDRFGRLELEGKAWRTRNTAS
jgi:GntR family transcriptional regulator, rspAB operon transcriptional repressor